VPVTISLPDVEVRGTNWSAHVLDGTLADMRRTAALIVAALGGRVDVLS
jgi:hypothetical protein